jgi:hypothetical protein
MRKYITEILDDINKDVTALETYKNNAAVKTLFEYAFLPEKKIDLPEGDPPFKPDPGPLGMTPANFFQETRKFYVFNRKDLPKLRREQLFIQLLEALHPSEAKIIVAMKDQNLNSLYNNITHQVLAQYGLIPEQKETPDGDQASKKS